MKLARALSKPCQTRISELPPFLAVDGQGRAKENMKDWSRRLWYLITQIPIDPAVWYIAVGLGHPGGAGATNGGVVHPLKTYMSWVQNVNWALLGRKALKNTIGSYR